VSVQWTPAITIHLNYDGQLGRQNYDSNAATGWGQDDVVGIHRRSPFGVEEVELEDRLGMSCHHFGRNGKYEVAILTDNRQRL
jgi:hypothetical protein